MRLDVHFGVPVEAKMSVAIDVLHSLTSFESYDNMLQGGRSAAEVEALLKRSARLLIGLPA